MGACRQALSTAEKTVDRKRNLLLLLTYLLHPNTSCKLRTNIKELKISTIKILRSLPTNSSSDISDNETASSPWFFVHDPTIEIQFDNVQLGSLCGHPDWAFLRPIKGSSISHGILANTLWARYILDVFYRLALIDGALKHISYGWWYYTHVHVSDKRMWEWWQVQFQITTSLPKKIACHLEN